MCCCLKLPLINISSCLTTGIVANTRFDVSRTQQVAPRCLDAKSFYCDKIDFGRNAAFFFFPLRSDTLALTTTAHGDKCLHQPDQISQGACSCVCVKGTHKTSDLRPRRNYYSRSGPSEGKIVYTFF